MTEIIKSYFRLERNIVYLIIADFFLQLINASFFLLLNYFMVSQGYEDSHIGGFTSWRFLAVFVLAFPFGFFIKGRKLKPFFIIAAVFCPLTSLCILYGIEHHLQWVIKLSLALWGASFMCLQTTSFPYLLNNVRRETHSEAITLLTITNPLAMVLAGLSYAVLKYFAPDLINEQNMLIGFSLLGFCSILFVLLIRGNEITSQRFSLKQMMFQHDFAELMKVMMPTLIIAVGAGFTIPFINLFFLKVHHLSSGSFSAIVYIAYIPVIFGMLIIPAVRRNYGYKITITLIQSLSIVALIVMATTEFYSGWKFAMEIAVVAYILRQPLMGVAQPSTTELTLYYVSPHNRELVSAISASIWAGSWYFSSLMFKYLRQIDIAYGWIFLITAALYIIGVIWYYYLIEDYIARPNRHVTEI